VSGATASFYFDLANPLAYFAAEQVLQVLPGAAEWQPVLARKLPVAERFEGWRCEQDLEVAIAELARRAGELGLQPLRLPAQFPFDSELAMRVATYAKSIGRTVPYAQAAYRQAFAGGRDLAEPDNVVIAAAACEMHPAAVLRGAKLRSVGEQLVSATAQAFDAGVRDVPAVRVGDRVFHGERSLGEAAAAIAIGGDRSDAGRVASTPGGARADFRLDVIEEGR
jgi:2-hydroxychromene-2-carboxylate isomerase